MIKIDGLTHIYNHNLPTQRVAVDNVSLQIKRGEIVGIIGHTGSGKSTLIQHLNGLIKPTKGKIYIDGQDIFTNNKVLRDIRFKVGLVFQYPEYQLFEETIYKDIAFGPKNMKLSDDEINERVLAALKFTGINPKAMNMSPFDLSGGQKRRVAIAGVLAMEPEVLVLDEPAAGLDPIGRKAILSQIKKYQVERNATVILVSHSMEDVATYADKVIVMDDGKVVCYDTMENVFNKSDDLLKIGLDVPQITRIMMGINKRYPDINKNIYDVRSAKNAILNYIKRSKDA